jgi:hypothetical protein
LLRALSIARDKEVKSLWCEQVRRTLWKRKGDFGFNARTEEFESLDDAGVRSGQGRPQRAGKRGQRAASLLITTETAVAEKPREARSHARGCPLVPAWEEWAVGWVEWAVWTTSEAMIFSIKIMCSLLSSQTHYLARYCEDESRLSYFNKFVAVTICVV